MNNSHQVGEFVRFAITGSIGFCVDLLVLLVLVHAFGVAPLVAKVMSFGVAMPTTWLINHMWTFRRRLGAAAKLSLKEFAAYLAIQLVGAGANYATFAMILLTTTLTGDFALIVATAAGVCAGMLINFTGNRRLVFRRRANSRPALRPDDWM
jgi:putative flippase GtrA